MAQVNKISSFKSFTEVKNQEATMKLREENNAKRQETVGKIGAILDEMGLTSLSELDEDRKQALISKMFGNVSEDEAEDIEDELNKLGEPKKLEEGNAFIFAASKARQEGKDEFEFNGKTYKVTLKKDTGLKEGNAFGDAVRKAKEAGETEFEFEGETYKVEEALVVEDSKINFVTITNDLFNADSNWWVKNKLKVSNDISKALNGCKIKHVVIDIDKVHESILNEGRSIAKIQTEWSKLTTQMQATAQNWKAAEGSAKEALLGKLKEMTAQKKALEAELDTVIADKDKDIELVVTEAFFRLPKDVIGNELYLATQNLSNLYGRTLAGNDIDAGVIDTVIKALTTVKKSIKKFNNKEEVLGTVYEGEILLFDEIGNELEALKNKISGLMKSATDKKWVSALGTALTSLSNLDRNLSQQDAKLGAIITESSVIESGFRSSSPSAEATHRAEQLKKLKKLRDHREEQDRIKKAQLKRAKVAGSAKESVVTESHFKVGDTVKMSHGGSGVIVSIDKEHGDEDEKYYNVELPNGDIHKHSPNELTKESVEVNEAEIKSDDEFKEYAMTVLKKAFGADFDEAKAGEVVDGILTKCDGDYGACVGMLTSSLGESTVTESKGFKNTKDFEAFLEEIDGMGEYQIKKIMGKDYIDTPGFYADEAEDYDNDIVEFMISNMGQKEFKKLQDYWENNVQESVVTEKFDANYWEDYHDSGESGKTKNPTGMQVQQEVSGCVEDWNDNNEDGPDNEVTPAGEKKVLKLAKEFVKAKGWISSDIIDAMIAQES